jgi:hypothetical protein
MLVFEIDKKHLLPLLVLCQIFVAEDEASEMLW